MLRHSNSGITGRRMRASNRRVRMVPLLRLRWCDQALGTHLVGVFIVQLFFSCTCGSWVISRCRRAQRALEMGKNVAAEKMHQPVALLAPNQQS